MPVSLMLTRPDDAVEFMQFRQFGQTPDLTKKVVLRDTKLICQTL